MNMAGTVVDEVELWTRAADDYEVFVHFSIPRYSEL
jgi:hypothetical protein